VVHHAEVLLIRTVVVGSCLLGCRGNECDFIERCAADVREICGEEDQQFNRKVRREPCLADTPKCVHENPSITRCVAEDVATCDDGFEESCEGDVRVFCSKEVSPDTPRYVLRDDCTKRFSRSCVDTGKAASCQ
jgi:hypothetical protein